MLSHFNKSASILTDQETQMAGNDRRLATICNTVRTCRFMLLKSADFFDVQKLNYFAIKGLHRTLQMGKLVLEFYDEFFQFCNTNFIYRTSILK